MQLPFTLLFPSIFNSSSRFLESAVILKAIRVEAPVGNIEKARQTKAMDVLGVNISPAFDNLRSGSWFHQFSRRIRVPH
jgi:hypothetical protein